LSALSDTTSFAAAVQRAGFAHAPFADPAPAVRDAVTADIPGLAAHEANVRVIRDGFARIDATAALPGLQALLGAWQPDVILRETFEDGSYVAAERNEIPHAQVGVVLAWFEEFGLSVVEEPLNELRASVGLGPDPGLVRLRAAPHLTCVPMSLEHSAVPGPGHTYRFRDSAADRRGADLPDWWNGSSALLVYVSLGTAAAQPGLFPDLDRAVVGSLADLRVRVLLTTGGGDPVALDELRPLVPVGRPVVGTAGAGRGRCRRTSPTGFARSVKSTTLAPPMHQALMEAAEMPNSRRRGSRLASSRSLSARRPHGGRPGRRR
jgi:hypothetical protein